MLKLAVEVAYFPPIQKIPERAALLVKQGFDKLVALKNHLLIDGTPFCREAIMVVFTNHTGDEHRRLGSDLRRLELPPDYLYIS